MGRSPAWTPQHIHFSISFVQCQQGGVLLTHKSVFLTKIYKKDCPLSQLEIQDFLCYILVTKRNSNPSSPAHFFNFRSHRFFVRTETECQTESNSDFVIRSEAETAESEVTQWLNPRTQRNNPWPPKWVVGWSRVISFSRHRAGFFCFLFGFVVV